MADHRFVYTVSGVNLSDTQKTKISEAIGVAVAEALVADAPGAVRTDCLTVNRIYGGRWIPIAEAEAVGVQKILTDPQAAAAHAPRNERARRAV
jgi:hypothetical protein